MGVKKTKQYKNGTYEVSITCDTCDKPITHSNKYGMFCEDNCGYAECKKIGDRMGKLFKGLTGSKEEVSDLFKGMMDIAKDHERGRL